MVPKVLQELQAQQDPVEHKALQALKAQLELQVEVEHKAHQVLQAQ